MDKLHKKELKERGVLFESLFIWRSQISEENW
jgi:hypothetical protein